MLISRASRTRIHRTARFGYGLMAAAALMAAVQAASAATTYTWLASPTDDNWTTATGSIDWYNGTSDTSWDYSGDASGDTAIFNVASTTINVTDTISVTNVDFNTNGWVLADGGGTLQGIGGTGGPINFNVAGGDTATVNAVIGTLTSVTMQGGGTLILGSQNNTFGGTVTVNGGTLKLTGSIDPLTMYPSPGTITIASGGVFDLAGNTGYFGGNGANATLTGGTFVYDNTGSTGAKSATITTLTFSSGDGTVQNIKDPLMTSSTLTVTTLAARVTGATGNFISGGASDTNNAIVISNMVIAGSSVVSPAGFINQGTFFNGADYAVMDGAGTFVRAPVYGTDANFAAADATGASLADSSTSNYLVTTNSIASQASAGANTIKFGGGGTVNMALASNATLTLASGGLLVSGGTSTTISGSGTADITGSLNTELVFRTDTADDNLTVNVPLAADGTFVLTKSGAGTLTLGAANTFTGTVFVDGGTLRAGVASVANVSGAFGNNSLVNMSNAAGGTLDLNNLNTQIGSITGGGAYGGNVSLGTATLTVGGDNTSPAAAYGGSISGSGGVTKVGTGTQMLLGANTYGGTTTVSTGTLDFVNEVSLYNGNTADWNAAHITVAPGATLALNVGTAGHFTAADVQTINANAGFASGALIGIFTTNATGVFTYANTLTDTVNGPLGVKLSTGSPNLADLTLSGNNTYTGPTVISGSVKVGVASGPGYGALGNNSAITIANANGVDLNLSGFNTQIGSLTSVAGGGTGEITLNGATLTIGGDNTSPAAYAGWIVNGTGTGNVVKVGTGTLTLTGNANNYYTGTTTINGGTLALASSGSINSSSGITVNGTGAKFLNNSSTAVTAPITITSGTIGGSGTISAAGGVSIGSNATISPGNSPAIQQYTTGVTFASGGTYKWEINTAPGAAGTNFDQLAVTGGLNVTATSGSPFTIDITGLTAANVAGVVPGFNDTTSYDWKIASSDTLTGYNASDFSLLTSNFANNNPLGGGSFAIHIGTDIFNGNPLDGNANDLFVTFTPAAVPEPASLALLGLGALGLLKRRRR